MLFGKKKEKQVQNQPEKTINKKQAVVKKNKQQPIDVRNIVSKKNKKMSFFEIYDDLWANKKLGNAIVDDGKPINNERVNLQYGKMVTKDNILKYFTVDNFPYWLETDVLEKIRRDTIHGTIDIKFNYYVTTEPSRIDWDSRKMKIKARSWERIVGNSTVDESNVFRMRENKNEIENNRNKVLSYQFYNTADLEQHRSVNKTSVYFSIIGKREDTIDLENAITNFKKACAGYQLDVNEIKADIFDWNRTILPTSLREDNNVEKMIAKRELTDDIVANMLGTGQGKIGSKGIPLGEDVYSGLQVLKVLRENVDDAENILISAETGGGKSVFVKNLLTWLQMDNVIMIADWEGFEYTDIANLINNGHEGDAVIVDMSTGSNSYFDPLRIADMTGNELLDKSAKSDAINFAMTTFKILLGHKGNTDSKTLKQEQIISECIKNVYRRRGITDNPKTWYKSKELKISMVYDELLFNIKRHQWVEGDDDRKHEVATEMKDMLRRYFVEGEADYGIFGTPLNIEDLRNARMIVFSLGNKGATNTVLDVKMQLKQLSISNITSQIANYCKYIRKTFNVQIYEEFQRWCENKEMTDILVNTITGGRKLNTINIIITNDLNAMLDEENKVLTRIKDNISGFCIGAIRTKQTREKFCNTFDYQLVAPDLKKIADENKKGGDGQFNKAFCCIFKATKKSPEMKTIVKATVHPAVLVGLYGATEQKSEENGEKEVK